jgi:hypothetical protein
MGLVMVILEVVLLTTFLPSPSSRSEPSAGPPNLPEATSHGTPPVGVARDTTPTPTLASLPDYRFLPHRLSQVIEFCVNPEGGPAIDRPLIDVVNDAVTIWQLHARGVLPLSVAGLCPGTPVEYDDGVSVVAWRSTGSGILGWTWMADRRTSVHEADIVLNASPPSISGERCLLATLLHELGHVLGLDHQDQGPSIMMKAIDCVPALSEADIAAVRFLYP